MCPWPHKWQNCRSSPRLSDFKAHVLSSASWEGASKCPQFKGSGECFPILLYSQRFHIVGLLHGFKPRWERRKREVVAWYNQLWHCQKMVCEVSIAFFGELRRIGRKLGISETTHPPCLFQKSENHG